MIHTHLGVSSSIYIYIYIAAVLLARTLTNLCFQGCRFVPESSRQTLVNHQYLDP